MAQIADMRIRAVESVERVAAPSRGIERSRARVVRECERARREGEIVGLIGPNGAGKTTFFNCLTGLYKPTEGQVTFNGSILPPKPRAVVIAGMARTFQNIRLFGNMTALENVMVGRYCRTSAAALTSIIRGPKFNASWRSPGPWRPTRSSSCSTSRPRA